MLSPLWWRALYSPYYECVEKFISSLSGSTALHLMCDIVQGLKCSSRRVFFKKVLRRFANNGGDAKNKNKSRRLVLIKRGGATKGAALHIEHNNKY
jgi:hypothetical protein